jgi:hypothetical protein
MVVHDLVIAFLLACHSSPLSDAVSADGLVELGPAQVCEAPVAGPDRLQLSDRGVDHVMVNEGETDPCGAPRGALVAQDLDLDGDPDLLVLDRDGLHAAWDNRDGQLVEVPLALGTERTVYTLGAADLDGDALPELIVAGADLVLVSRNLGGLRFGAWESVYDEPDYPRSCFSSLGLADVDGDGDLDLSVAALDHVPDEDHVSWGNIAEPEGLEAGADLLFDNASGELSLIQDLDGELPRLSLLHAWTDRDQDGDLDLLAGTDRYVAGVIGESTSLRNDGSSAEGPLLFEDGGAVGFDNGWALMGMASWDQDGDGWLDHCFTALDFSLKCLRGDGIGGFYEVDAGLSVDLELVEVPEDPVTRVAGVVYQTWVPWGLAVADLDADGFEDVLTVAGPPPEAGNAQYAPVPAFQPDWRWRGTREGYESGVGVWTDEDWSYALAQADLDGDGYRELIKSPDQGELLIYDNPCGDHSWLEVEVLEPQGHPAFGAQVRVLDGGQSWMREVQAVRALGQSVSAVHFGLADADTVDIEVRYPSGQVVTATDLPVNRRVTVHKP